VAPVEERRAREAIMTACRRCEIDLMHCHGTLVRHDDGGWECSAADCTGDVDTHDVVLVCADQLRGAA
jgi:hypothetical protein